MLSSLSAWVWVSSLIFSMSGSLNLNQNTFLPITAHKDVPITIKVEGKDPGGDVDCYLQAANMKGQGWVFVAMDERTSNNCEIRYIPQTDQPLRLWLTNHGTRPTNYVANITQ